MYIPFHSKVMETSFSRPNSSSSSSFHALCDGFACREVDGMVFEEYSAGRCSVVSDGSEAGNWAPRKEALAGEALAEGGGGRGSGVSKVMEMLESSRSSWSYW